MKRSASFFTLAILLSAGLAFGQQSKGTQQITGTVEDQRVIQSRDQQQHLVIRVQPDDAQQGEFKFVDLGDPANLRSQNVQINEGDNVSIRGQQDEIDGRSVIAADRITVEGQRYSLAQQQEQRSSQQAQRPERMTTQERQELYAQNMKEMQEKGEQESSEREPREQIGRYDESQENLSPTGGQAEIVRGEVPSERMTTQERQELYAQNMKDMLERAEQESSEQESSEQESPEQIGGSVKSEEKFSSTGGPSELIRGEVASLRDFSLEGVADKHRMIKVTDANDASRTYIVDLGPTNALQKLDLEEGDRVLIQGQKGQIQGRSVVRATQIAEVIQLQHTAQQQQQTSSLREMRQQQRLERQQAGQDSLKQSQDDSMRERTGKPKEGSDQSTVTQTAPLEDEF